MSSIDTDRRDDDDEKLLPEWGQTADNQIIWLGLLVAALMGLLFFGLSQCGDTVGSFADDITGGADGGGAGESVALVLDDDGDLGDASDLFDDADLDIDLEDADGQDYTVFAPTDAAFEDAGIDVGDLASAAALSAAGFHVVEGRILSGDLEPGDVLETIGGDEIVIGDDGTLNNGIEIVDADQRADNGIVHSISGVLAAQAAPPAPTAVPTAVPEPTAVPATPVPPTPVPPTPVPPTPVPPTPVPPTPVPAPPAAFTIADLASQEGLTTLGAAAGLVGLGDAIADADAGPFTVFAPTDEAFDQASAIADRLNDDQLNRVVRYHVVEGLVPSSDLVPGATFETIQGESLTVGEGGIINGSIAVISADNEADNGIVHVIGNVLVPPSVQRELLVSDLNALFALEPIQFAVNSAEILGDSVPTLDNAVEILSTAPAGSLIRVEGHTDSDGDDASNQALSEARSASVLGYLTANGVDPSILTSTGFGETQPIADNATPEGKAQNRRIEFNILDEG